MAKINYEIIESEIIDTDNYVEMYSPYFRVPTLNEIKIHLSIKIKNPKLKMNGVYKINSYRLNYKNKIKYGNGRDIHLSIYKKHNERWQNLEVEHKEKEISDFRSSLDKEIKILIDNYFIKKLQSCLEEQESSLRLHSMKSNCNILNIRLLKRELKKVPIKKIEELKTKAMSEIIMSRVQK